MKNSAIAAGVAGLATVAQAALDGFDISHYQPDVDYKGAYDAGARFVMIKATESTTYTDPSFSTHYKGALDAGLIRGGYHFARPADSSGATQAKYFLEHGGNWSGDGHTLPGMLDLEYNPDGDDCYGLSASDMTSWISDFVESYHDATKVYPLIYTSTSWWEACTGNSDAFGDKSPLVVARYSDSVGELPAGWSSYSFWQFNDSYKFGGDSQTFNGDEDQLKKIAKPS